MNRFIILLFSAILFVSCFEDEQRGYPRHANFDENGGTVTVSGDDYFLGLVILDDDDRGSAYSETPYLCDTIHVENGWLKAYQLSYDNKLVLIAEPLEDGVQKRSVKLECSFGDAVAYIIVKQKRK